MGDVPCNSCTLCCRGQFVVLDPQRDDLKTYDFVWQQYRFGPMAVLKQKIVDGMNVCVYLGEKGCTIHHRAPATCRDFDCRKEFSRFTRQQRKQMVKAGTADKAIFDRGRELLGK